jgi:hypothetical protein
MPVRDVGHAAKSSAIGSERASAVRRLDELFVTQIALQQPGSNFASAADKFPTGEDNDMTTEDRLAALEAQVQDLMDRKAIYECLQRTSRGNDRFDKDLIVSGYHEDGVHELGAKQISGQEYGDHANHAHGAICDVNLHNLTMHSCDIDGDVAHCESYVIGLFTDKGAQMSRMLAGRYIDRLEKRNGEWRIALRRATVEVVLEGAAKLPNGLTPPGTGYLKGNRDRTDPSYERPLSLQGGERW